MEELMICPIDDSYKVAESTSMVRDAFNYVVTKRQMDLIYAIISLINKDDDLFAEYKIPFREIASIYNPANPDSKEIKRYVEEATDKIMDSHFSLKNEKGNKVKYHWVKRCEISESEKCVYFKLDEEVREFYISLKENQYTVYLLKDLLALSTIFQANLFRWLSCNSGFENQVTIKIENAKTIFYGNEIETKALIRKIDSALKKINKLTNINASYEKIVGRNKKIESLKFEIQNKYIRIEKKDDTRNVSAIKSYSDKGKKMWQENLDLKAENEKLKRELESAKGKKND